jgi:hypothetical protein
MKNTLYIVGLVVAFFIGHYFATPEVVEVERVEYDTIFYERPTLSNVTRTEFRTIRLPIMLFAPADTVWRERMVVDSVEVEVAMERRMYQDSTYRAQVSGPAIGGFHPSLDWVEVLNKNTYTTTTIKKPRRWGVGVQVGYGMSREGLSPYIGVGISYNLITF